MKILRVGVLKNDKLNNILNSKVFNGFLLVVLFTVFSLFYIRNVVMLQNGWWQYFAWRMNEGEILYKDVYLFIPPYFPMFTSVLYKLFGTHFILYNIFVGYPIKVCCILLTYSFICRFSKPFFASISVLIGACIGATYLTDVWYDYNPVLMLPSLLVAYCVMKFYESKNKKSRYFYAFLLGGLGAILLGTKQTLGITIGIITIVMIIILHIKEKTPNCWHSILFFIIGFIVGIFPCVYYIVHNDCMHEFIYCMSTSIGAKGGEEGLLDHLISIMSNIEAWCFSILLFLVMILCDNIWKKRFLNQEGEDDNKKKKYNKYILVLCCLLSVFFVYIFKDYMVKVFDLLLNYKIIFILLIAGISFACIIGIYLKKNSKKNGNEGKLYFLYYNVLLICLLIWGNWNIGLHKNLYDFLSILSLRRILIVIFSYLFLLLWGRKLVAYFLGEKGNYSVLMCETIICVHFFTGIISAGSLEELFMLLYLPWGIVALFNLRISFANLKNVVLLVCLIPIVLFSLSGKLYVPYDWQGWKTPSITQNDVNCEVEGLEGYLVSKSVNNEFQKMVDLIRQNTDEKDTVYQFANIPLFNVLTERKIPTYGVISWFDVLPDKIACGDAEMLRKDNPKMVIWNEMSNDEWNLLENVFRNGEESGQRSIKNFYSDIVVKEYEKIYEFDNNRDGTIQLWLRKK